MLVKDIKEITLEKANEIAEKGIYFIIRDGQLKGLTKN